MGMLYYGSQPAAVEVDDRTLMHLQVVIITKLRRDEQFAFSWDRPMHQGSGHETLWLEPSIALRFVYSRRISPDFNRAWIDELMSVANGPRGLSVVPEPRLDDQAEAPN